MAPSGPLWRPLWGTQWDLLEAICLSAAKFFFGAILKTKSPKTHKKFSGIFQNEKGMYMSTSKNSIGVGDLVSHLLARRPAIVIEQWGGVSKIQLVDEAGLRQNPECVLTDQLHKITA